MSDHIFTDVDVLIGLSVMHLKAVAEKAGHDRAAACHGLDRRSFYTWYRFLDRHGHEERACLVSERAGGGGGGGLGRREAKRTFPDGPFEEHAGWEHFGDGGGWD